MNSREFFTYSLDGLRSRYDFEAFLKIDQVVRETKQVPQEVFNIFQSCRSETSQEVPRGAKHFLTQKSSKK